jgi:hypothetical protein
MGTPCVATPVGPSFTTPLGETPWRTPLVKPPPRVPPFVDTSWGTALVVHRCRTLFWEPRWVTPLLRPTLGTQNGGPHLLDNLWFTPIWQSLGGPLLGENPCDSPWTNSLEGYHLGTSIDYPTWVTLGGPPLGEPH